jgi:hypothetical protein
MTSLGVIGLVLGVPFGLLLGGLLVANGEDSAAPDLALRVELKSTRTPSRLEHRRPDLPLPAILRAGRILGRADGPDGWARRGPAQRARDRRREVLQRSAWWRPRVDGPSLQALREDVRLSDARSRIRKDPDDGAGTRATAAIWNGWCREHTSLMSTAHRPKRREAHERR